MKTQALPMFTRHVCRPRPSGERLTYDAKDHSVVERKPTSGRSNTVIDRALATLPPDMRLLVILRDVHGLSYDEITRIVKMRPGTVDSKLFRARQRLRPMLEEYVSRT